MLNAVEVKPGIYWVGGVDWNERNFHGYSRSPRGTTYNSYLVRDEKNVVFDTVDNDYAGTMFCRLAKLMPLDKVDYIVVNHTEKDHAGALCQLVERCKPEKIITSTIDKRFMEAQFDTTGWPIEVVKSGDKLNIGKRNIIFQETRMLHWPDSMVSYIPEDKLLISNDAFGQNIATSYRYADEHDQGDFVRAIKEYYYNIVLPYSPQVLKTLPIVESLDIDMIAPDHGLIHRGEKSVKFIVDMYRQMAEQKPQQRAMVIYDTMWHSTEKMAYAVCSGLEEVGVPTRLMSVKSNHHSEIMTELANCGAVIAGSPTHNNTIMPLMASTLTYMKGLRPQNRVGGAFGSFGWSGESAKVLHEMLASMGMDMPADFVKCNWTPRHEALRACVELGKTVGEALKKKCQGE